MDVQLTDRFRHRVTAQILVTARHVVMKMKNEIVGQFSRQDLQEWLARPQGEMSSGRAIWMAVPNGVALGVQDTVDVWPLPDRKVAQLRRILAAEEPSA